MNPSIILIVALEDELDRAQLPADIPVVYSGVGKINAAIATSKAIYAYQPDLIVNFGTVGRINPAISGLIEIGKVIQRDMCAEPLAPRGIVPFSAKPNVFHANVGAYTCGTGDSFVTQADAWLASNGVDVVDMELFAIAAVAHEFGIAWKSYKFISDDANGSSGDEWAGNVNLGATLFLDKFRKDVAPLGKPA